MKYEQLKRLTSLPWPVRVWYCHRSFSKQACQMKHARPSNWRCQTTSSSKIGDVLCKGLFLSVNGNSYPGSVRP
eukprot:3457505-Rhodomonas_salina.1